MMHINYIHHTYTYTYIYIYTGYTYEDIAGKIFQAAGAVLGVSEVGMKDFTFEVGGIWREC